MDKLDPARRSENMRRIKGKGTRPELAIRTALHRLGYRYRLHAADLPGKPDLVFRTRRKVILIHGCFWHQHDGCKITRLPKSNTAYWTPKLLANKSRDTVNLLKLTELGWEVLTIWECELTLDDLLPRICSFLGPQTGKRRTVQVMLNPSADR